MNSFWKPTDTITCSKNFPQIGKAFELASKNLSANDKHFDSVYVKAIGQDSHLTLEDDTFGDITFELFLGSKIGKIGANTFKKAAQKFKFFICLFCALEYQPPKYDLKNMLNQMTELKLLMIGLNFNEIPTDFIKPINGQQSKLINLQIGSLKSLTIKSRAFQNLNQLYIISISHSTINLIENEAFKFINRNQNKLKIIFANCKLTGKF